MLVYFIAVFNMDEPDLLGSRMAAFECATKSSELDVFSPSVLKHMTLTVCVCKSTLVVIWSIHHYYSSKWLMKVYGINI